MKLLTPFIIVLLATLSAKAHPIDSLRESYYNCFDSLENLIRSNSSFKKAVFLTENCFLNNQMSYENFDKHVNHLVTITKHWQQANPLSHYHFKDSANLHQNLSVYKILKDTIKFINLENKTYYLVPYGYDFEDFLGKDDWSNMFVTKLLSTHKGNCHSLPYLYKILADELGAKCWLSLAPNHIYIKNLCSKIGWYNTELTSGEFPIDAWITASGYIPLRAVQTGLYMDTLSNQQAIALCMLDLAKGYEFQTKNYYDGFILKCCDVVLQYNPINSQALLLKAETLKRIYEKQEKEKDPMAKDTYATMEQLYVKLLDLGYREMPEEMYLKWLLSVTKQRDKYSNKRLQETFQGNKKAKL